MNVILVKTVLQRCMGCGVFTLAYRVKYSPRLSILCVTCAADPGGPDECRPSPGNRGTQYP